MRGPLKIYESNRGIGYRWVEMDLSFIAISDLQSYANQMHLSPELVLEYIIWSYRQTRFSAELSPNQPLDFLRSLEMAKDPERFKVDASTVDDDIPF